MEIFKNKKQVNYIILQQFSVNSEILEFKFKKEENSSFEGCVAEIIFENDKLSSVYNDNISINEVDGGIVVNWVVNNSINLTPGKKKLQIVLKKDNFIFLSNVFEISVSESLDFSNEIVETVLNYLEYWEHRINELAKKVEDGISLNFDDLTDEEKAKLKGEKGDRGEPGEIPVEILNTLQTKEDSSLNTNDKSIVGAINEIKSNITDLPKQDILAGNGVSIDNGVVSVTVDEKTIGFNDNGKLEARLFTGGNDEGNTNIKQYLIKNVVSGQIYTVNDEGLPVNHKIIPCVLAIENSKTNSSVITDFKIDIQDITSNNGLYIKDIYDYSVENRESPVINKAEFNEILSIKGGV